MRIRRAEPRDLDAIVAIEDTSFTAAWSRSALAGELAEDPRRLAVVAEEDEEVIGYAFVWIVADELHLVSLAVAPGRRRQGIASAMMGHLLQSEQTRSASIMTLEVRASNEPALALYRRWGFLEVAIRPRYYPDDKEDALVMLKVLRPPDQEGSIGLRPGPGRTTD
jgi:ribosomal-protein-alanine N-acetyltransferase